MEICLLASPFANFERNERSILRVKTKIYSRSNTRMNNSFVSLALGLFVSVDQGRAQFNLKASCFMYGLCLWFRCGFCAEHY